MAKKSTKNWYALYTAPRAEKQVKERLEAQRIEGLTCWLPLHRTPRVWSDRVKMVEIPLFNSYIFVNCEEHQLRPLLQTYGVVRIVYYNGKPAVIRQREIDAIKEFLEKAANNVLVVGDEVEILTGSMKKVSGKVKKINKNHLVLSLDQLGATVIAKIEEVAKINRIK